MRSLIVLAVLLVATPAFANPPGADYCMSRLNHCLANAVGATQAGYCRANMDLCMKRPPAHRSGDLTEAPASPVPDKWTTTVKSK